MANVSNSNGKDGSGDGIVFVYFPTATISTSEIETGGLGIPRGVVVKTTGTIKVELRNQSTPVQVLVFEGKDNLYSITKIYSDGSGDIPITDCQLIW